MKDTVSGSDLESHRFVGKREISRATGLSGDTLKHYRLHLGLLIENIHWIRINSKVIRYNLPLMLDWMQNRNDPVAHQRAIEQYFSKLPSNLRTLKKARTST